MSSTDIREEAEKIRDKADKTSAGGQLGGTFYGQEPDSGSKPREQGSSK